MLIISTPIEPKPLSPSAAGFRVAVEERWAVWLEITPALGDPQSLEPIALTLEGEITSIDLPEDTRPSSLIIDGKTYAYTLQNPPSGGQFTVIGGQLKVGTTAPIKAISYHSQPLNIPTDFVPPPYPDLFYRYPIKGEVSWSLNFEEQPSGNFRFITLATERQSIIDYLSGSPALELYGVGVTVGQVTVTEISRSKSSVPLIEVSVNLTGIHAKDLDLQTAIGKQLYLPDCSAPPTGQENSPDRMTIQDLAAQLGTSVTGPAIWLPEDILKSPATPTSLGTHISESNLRAIGCFVDYNSPGSIRLVSYGSGQSHLIEEHQIRSDIQTTVNATTNGYYRTYDPLVRVTYGANYVSPPTTNLEKPKWQPKKRQTSKAAEGDPYPFFSPYTGTQKDPSIVFDISGQRKRRKQSELIDGKPYREQEEEWGYVAVGKDDINFTSDSNPTIASIDGNWTQISSKTTTYNYNEDGYLTSVTTSGRQLVRYRTETAQKPESLSVRSESGDEREIANLETYRFFWLPTTTTETYRLEPLSDYYSDIKRPQVNYKICLPDGSGQIEIPVDDKSWIPPYFVAERAVVEDGFASTVNPKSTALKPLPPLTTGKSVRMTERVRIIPGIDGKDPDTYVKTTDRYSSQGAQFGNYTDTGESQIVQGRPPIAPNLGAKLELVPPTPPNTKPPEPKDPFFIRSGLSPASTGYVATSSLDYPSAESQAQAMSAAKLAIDIINSKNTVQESFGCDFRPDIRPGDTVSYRVNGSTRTSRVFGVTHRLTIDGIQGHTPHVTSPGTELKLGVDILTPVSFAGLAPRTTSLMV